MDENVVVQQSMGFFFLILGVAIGMMFVAIISLVSSSHRAGGDLSDAKASVNKGKQE